MKKVYLCTLCSDDVIARLKKGEVVKIEGSDTLTYKWFDGFICRFFDGKMTDFNLAIDLEDSDLYFEEEEKFEVRETGLYRTRDGKEAFVGYIDYKGKKPQVKGIIIGKTRWSLWDETGKANRKYFTEHDDLVGRWEE